MASVLIPDTVKVCVKFEQNGEQACNVYHVNVGGDPDETVLNAVGLAFINWIINDYAPLINQDTVFTAVEVTDVSEVDGEGIILTDSLPEPGGQLDTPLPNNVSVAVKLASGFTGRSRRGRKFIGGLGETALTADRQQITSTFQGLFQDAFEALLDQITTAGWQWVVASTISGGVPRTTGITTAITGIVVDTFLDSMRKRLSENG